MALLNIPSTVVDPSYRYKMPCIISRKDGRGNGKQTSIINISDVAEAIQRDPAHITKFLGYELCTQASYSNQSSEGERAIFRGHHEPDKFQSIMDKFIDMYVVCPGCGLPEIDLLVQRGMVAGKCRACRWKGELDNTHRLASHMAKHLPSSKGAKPAKPDGKDGKVGKQQKEGQASTHRHNDNKNDDSDEGLTHDCAAVSSVVGALQSFVAAKGSALSADAFYEEVRGQQVTTCFDNKLRMFVVASALFPDSSLDAPGLASRIKFIEAFQGRMAFADWIWGFEAYLAANPVAIKKWPLTLKVFYDNDLVEERELLEYYRTDHNNPGFKASRKAAAPFVEWLEMSSDDDSASSS